MSEFYVCEKEIDTNNYRIIAVFKSEYDSKVFTTNRTGCIIVNSDF